MLYYHRLTTRRSSGAPGLRRSAARDAHCSGSGSLLGAAGLGAAIAGGAPSPIVVADEGRAVHSCCASTSTRGVAIGGGSPRRVASILACRGAVSIDGPAGRRTCCGSGAGNKNRERELSGPQHSVSCINRDHFSASIASRGWALVVAARGGGGGGSAFTHPLPTE